MSIALRHTMANISELYKPIYGIRSDGIAYAALPNPVNASSGAYEVEFTFLSSGIPWSMHVFGAHGASMRNHFLWHSESTQQNGIYCFAQYSDSGNGAVYTADTKHLLVASLRSELKGVYLDGESIGKTMDSPTTNRNPFLIFRANNNSTTIDPATPKSPDYIVIHKLKVWYGENLVADLVPCIETRTKEVCFYNLVDEQFVKNIAGQGSKFVEVKE